MVTWVAVSLASLVRGLGVGMDVGAAAPDTVAGCRLRFAWVTKLTARLVRGLGVGVVVGAAVPDMVVGCRLWLLG